MFNNGKKENKNSAPRSAAPSSGGGHSLNSIVQGTNIEGTINAKNDLRVDGTISGKLFCEAKVIIGPTGKVDGEIRCANAVVEGSFEGTINVSELLNIRETGSVKGEITYGKLIVQPGANIEGNMSKSNGKNSGSIAGSAKKASEQKTAKVG